MAPSDKRRLPLIHFIYLSIFFLVLGRDEIALCLHFSTMTVGIIEREGGVAESQEPR